MSAFARDSLEAASLTGETTRHLCSPDHGEVVGALVHKEVVRPFLDLKSEAARAGFDLRILSGFRSFERQLSIWNRKATGELPVLDSDAHPLDIEAVEREGVGLRHPALVGAAGRFPAPLGDRPRRVRRSCPARRV